MNFERIRIADIHICLQKHDPADIWNQARSWYSTLYSISTGSDKPELQSSATLLGKAEYFLKLVRLLNAATETESIGRHIGELQETLVRKRRERRREERLPLVQRQIPAILRECRKSRRRLLEKRVVACRNLEDLKRNSDFYNKHLCRLGIPSDSPLRPDAWLGYDKAATTPHETGLAPKPVPGDPKPSKPKGGTQSGAHGIDPVKEPQLWLDHLPPFVKIDGKQVNKKIAVKWVLRITDAKPDQLVAAVLYFGYEVYKKAPIHRFLGISRRAVQYRIENFRKNAEKQDPNWAANFRGEQDVFRARIASRRP